MPATLQVRQAKSPDFSTLSEFSAGTGVERSFVLTQIRPRARAGNRIGLIFPASVVRALNPLYDQAARRK
jgi:hypothetical protein